MIYLITFMLIAGLLAAVSVKWELDRRISFTWAVAMGLFSWELHGLLFPRFCECLPRAPRPAF
jgi:hypothetical protein